MRLKIYCVQIYGFYSIPYTCTQHFFFLSTKTNQFAISEINLMRTKRTSSSVKSSPNSSRASSNLISGRFLEIIIDIQQVVFIHNILQEIVDIQFRSGVDDSFYLIQQLFKLNAL